MVRLEFGRATDTGFVTGKVVEKSKNPYLNQSKLMKALASVEGSNRRETFKYAKVSMQSQEAYELAAKGPIKPQEYAGTLIYNLKCIGIKSPFVEIELTACYADIEFILGLMTELAWRLKTTAVCHSVRCIRHGFFTLDNALLFKHLNLENVLNNMYENKALIESNYKNLIESTRHPNPSSTLLKE